LANAGTMTAEFFRLSTALAGQKRLLEYADRRLESAIVEIRGLKDLHRRKVGEIWRDITLSLVFHRDLEKRALQSPVTVVPQRDQSAFEQHGDDLVWELDNLTQRLIRHMKLVIEKEAKVTGVDLRRLRTWTPRPDQWTEKAKGMIPKPTFEGPFSLKQFWESFDDADWDWYQDLDDKGKAQRDFMTAMEQVCAWMDGKRDLLEIHQMLIFTENEVPLKLIVEFAQILRKHNWIALK
jgi:hypothetical protein